MQIFPWAKMCAMQGICVKITVWANIYTSDHWLDCIVIGWKISRKLKSHRTVEKEIYCLGFIHFLDFVILIKWKKLRSWLKFDLILLTLSENSNYWWETLLEVIRQNIAGWCQQTFFSQNFVDNNILPLHLKQTFPPKIWIFTQGEEDKLCS